MSDAAGALRLFFALWPPAKVQAGLAAWAKEAAGRGRPMRRENLHLTLAFLGATDSALLPRIEAVAAAVRADSFQLLLDRVGYWKHNRIIWCGSSVEPPALMALVAELRARLSAAGVRYDEKPFVPHLTLVRNATELPQTPAWMPVGWETREFALIESTRVEGRVTYQVLQRFPAAAG